MSFLVLKLRDLYELPGPEISILASCTNMLESVHSYK